jgi:DNA-directed RNA polymerase III subunit RPC8
LRFFNDVIIPDYALQNPSFFHDAERVWYWQYGEERLNMDPGAEVRFRVSAIRFNPMPTAAAAAAAAAAQQAAAPVVHAPMEVVGEMDGDGLGLIEWWQPPQEEEAADGVADMEADAAAA